MRFVCESVGEDGEGGRGGEGGRWGGGTGERGREMGRGFHSVIKRAKWILGNQNVKSREQPTAGLTQGGVCACECVCARALLCVREHQPHS